MSTTSGDFAGTARYELQRRLGAGGMGVVYLARDKERGVDVALKTLKRFDAQGLLRFKREFRALAGVTHPNLATLHDLVSTGDHWFFTMELVDGVDLLDWVRPGMSTVRAQLEEDTAPVGSLPITPLSLALPPLEVSRLRAALGQLVRGVIALHGSGRLHRDIKPSNVLVSRDGRVVLVDFGLVADLDEKASQSTGEVLVGTAAYMAPEQGLGGEPNAAHDWYSVGTLLFEALTGRLPFTGSPVQVLLDKQHFDAPKVATFAPDAPAQLRQICDALLSRDPDKRPSGDAVLEALGEATTVLGKRLRRLPAPVATTFVGRSELLAELHAAFDHTRSGGTSVVFVTGRSGVGKTTLVRHFLDALPEGTTVLSGRCYEREAVPFKTVDSLVDALSRQLSKLPPAQVEGLLPRDASALARVFPVLRRVRAFADAPRRGSDFSDPLELRRRAFLALRELLARLADRNRLVLFIDDLQWGDADSAALTAEVLQPPDAPSLMLIAAHRAGEAHAANRLREALTGVQATARVSNLSVSELQEQEATELARTLLVEAGLDADNAAQLARDSEGHPYFLDALVQNARSAGSSNEALLSVDDLVRRLVAAQPPAARRVIEVSAVAGRPLPRDVALRAAGAPSSDSTPLDSLRLAHLVRSVPLRDEDGIETWHDRVREAVLAMLPPQTLRETHGAVAAALELSGRADPEWLAFHWMESGDAERALEYTITAGQRAVQTLAFDRAAAFLQRALELLPPANPRRRQLLKQLGDALSYAGRGPDAAEAYQSAADAPGDRPLLKAEELELRRLAAEQLLRCGHIEGGLRAIRQVLADVGMKLEPTPTRALASLLLRRAQVRIRGFSFTPRDESQLSAEQIARLDSCWVAALGLSFVDPIPAADFHARHLLIALKAGEPYRVARALASEACFVSLAGSPVRPRVERLVTLALQHARQVDHPHAVGMVKFAAALADFLVGRWKSSRAQADEAEAIFREDFRALGWETISMQIFSLWSLYYLGEMSELSKRVPALRKEAAARGDRHAVTSTNMGLANIVMLMNDDPVGARKLAEESIAELPKGSFHFQHYWGLLSLALVDGYEDRAIDSHDRFNAAWSQIKKQRLFRVQTVRIESLHVRARGALARSLIDSDPEKFIRYAEGDARKLAKENVPWASAIALLIRAGVDCARGKTEQAAAKFETAEGALKSLDMALLAHGARYRRGELVGGATGAVLKEEAAQWMRQQGMKRPENWVQFLVAGPKR